MSTKPKISYANIIKKQAESEAKSIEKSDAIDQPVFVENIRPDTQYDECDQQIYSWRRRGFHVWEYTYFPFLIELFNLVYGDTPDFGNIDDCILLNNLSIVLYQSSTQELCHTINPMTNEIKEMYSLYKENVRP